MRYHGISWELMGEGALRGKIGVLVTEWRVTFLDALHKDSSPQSLAAHQQQMEAAIEDSAMKSDTQIAALQAQVTTQIDNQGHHIQGLFQAQLQQIEALLAKRARME